MANVKKAVQEEVTEKEIPRAAYEGVLTIDVDAQVESAQEDLCGKRQPGRGVRLYKPGAKEHPCNRRNFKGRA